MKGKMDEKGGEKMNRKFLVLATVAIIALLTSSIVVVSQAWMSPKPKYVTYVLKISVKIPAAAVVTHTDSSNFPVVVSDGYVPDTGIVPVATNVTINGVVYTFPKDFDYSYTYHLELNVVTGYGLEMIQETLTFNHLPGHPTLNGRTEEKVSGRIMSPSLDISHLEIVGNFQLTGTGMFSKVEGSGTGMIGVSTGMTVYHFAWISGWPL
jgi:hypothetical protein